MLEKLDEINKGTFGQIELEEALVKVVQENNLNIDSQGISVLVDTIFSNEDESQHISRKQVREALESIPVVKVLSKTIVAPVGQRSLESLILEHCEGMEKGTLNKTDIKQAISNAMQENNTVVAPS